MKSGSFNWPVIGHENIIHYLQTGIQNHSLAHGFIFSGPQGIGKKTTLRYFLASIFCQSQTKLPCMSCPACEQVKKHVFPDIEWVEPELDDKTGHLKKNISIGQIKRLKDKLGKYSFHQTYKVAVINQAEALSVEAANSLLKLLEEPSGETVIVLVASDYHNLLPTIISRCQVLSFRPVPQKLIVGWLNEQGVSKDKAEAMAHLASGRPGMANKFFRNQEFYELQLAVAISFINVLDKTIAERLNYVSELLKKNGQNYTAKSISALKEINVWQLVLRDLLHLQIIGPKYVHHYGLLPALEKLSHQVTTRRLMLKIGALENLKRMLKNNANPQLVLENAIINLI